MGNISRRMDLARFKKKTQTVPSDDCQFQSGAYVDEGFRVIGAFTRVLMVYLMVARADVRHGLRPLLKIWLVEDLRDMRSQHALAKVVGHFADGSAYISAERRAERYTLADDFMRYALVSVLVEIGRPYHALRVARTLMAQRDECKEEVLIVIYRMLFYEPCVHGVCQNMLALAFIFLLQRTH